MADKTVEVSTVSQHTVVSASTTTTTTLHGADAGNAQCTCDVNYLRSVQGITKMAEIVSIRSNVSFTDELWHLYT